MHPWLCLKFFGNLETMEGIKKRHLSPWIYSQACIPILVLSDMPGLLHSNKWGWFILMHHESCAFAHIKSLHCICLHELYISWYVITTCQCDMAIRGEAHIWITHKKVLKTCFWVTQLISFLPIVLLTCRWQHDYFPCSFPQGPFNKFNMSKTGKQNVFSLNKKGRRPYTLNKKSLNQPGDLMSMVVHSKALFNEWKLMHYWRTFQSAALWAYSIIFVFRV